MKKWRLSAIALTPLVLASTAAAAGGPVTATVTPDTPGAASSFAVSIAGPLPSGVPSSLSLTAQKGFTSDGTKAVTALCTSDQASTDSCPAGSVVGTGSAGTNILGTLEFTLAVGAPTGGDIADIYLIGKVEGAVLALPGTLTTPSGGGLTLTITGFPQIPGVSLTSLQLSAKGTNTVTTYTKKKVTTGKGKKKKTKTVKVPTKTTYSILHNPTACTAATGWTGSITATYSGTPTTLPFTATCSS